MSEDPGQPPGGGTGSQQVTREGSTSTAAVGFHHDVALTHIHDTTQGGIPGLDRNMNSELSALAGVQDQPYSLAALRAGSEDDLEAQAAAILSDIRRNDSQAPGSILMVASHLLGQGLGPSLISELLGDGVTTDAEALRLFHALQREAAWEQRALEEQRARAWADAERARIAAEAERART